MNSYNIFKYINLPHPPLELLDYRKKVIGEESYEGGQRKFIKYSKEKAAEEFARLYSQHENYFKKSREIRLNNYSNFVWLIHCKKNESLNQELEAILSVYLSKSNNPLWFLHEGTINEKRTPERLTV